jgi:hypothetical protein
MAIASERIVREAESSQSRHIREHFTWHCGDVVVVERQNFQLVKILDGHLVDANDLVVVELKAAKCWNAFKHSL